MIIVKLYEIKKCIDCPANKMVQHYDDNGGYGIGYDRICRLMDVEKDLIIRVEGMRSPDYISIYGWFPNWCPLKTKEY